VNSLVKIALRRPLTFIVMALLIMIFGTLAVLKSPTDIFPDIDIPVVSVTFQYGGLPPGDVASRIVNNFERTLSTTVNNIEHIESQSLPSYGLIKIFFQPGTDISVATAQVTSIAQVVVRQQPAGSTPPLILNYSASTVPILQMAQSSDSLPEQRVFDLAQQTVRPPLITVPGIAVPQPYGGRQRQIQIDLNPQAMLQRGVSAQDITNTIAAQNQILPGGTVKIGSLQYVVNLNNTAETVAQMNNLPVKVTPDGTTTYIRDVANVLDGAAPQTSIVHFDGKRAVLASILKNGKASTLAIIDGVKDRMPKVRQLLPDDYKITLLGDQSVFVKGAVEGVVREGVVAAALTSLMILVFLGSWRSTVIIATSIPLSILAAIAALYAVGQTMNIMTLGGLALAVGILVDDATVTIENINWHLEQGKDVETAILDGANQIVTPAFVSLLCICIVFVPMFFLPGVSGFLFVPLAEAVVFAMIASFILSRTLVPTLAMYLLKRHDPERLAFEHGSEHGAAGPAPRSPLVRFQRGFEAGFGRVREGYRSLLILAMTYRKRFVLGFLALVAASFALAPFLGTDFFPSVDAGQMTLHVRAPSGYRVEDTSALFENIRRKIQTLVPPDEIESVVDNIGLANSAVNLTFSNSGTIGQFDGDIYVNLKRDHRPTSVYMKTLREELPKAFPEATFSFLPADMVSQILNFGAPAPIDVQISGPNAKANRAYIMKLMQKLKAIPGLADVRLQQPETSPQLMVEVDRSRIAQLGLTERDVTNNLLTSLVGSAQASPNFWLNPQNGVVYPMVAQMPEYRVSSLADLENIPISGATGAAGPMQILGGLGVIRRDSGPAVVSRYDMQPVLDIYAAVQGRDLGGVAKDIRAAIKSMEKEVPRGAEVTLRGQIVTMDIAFQGLFLGLAAAIVLIYLLIVVNFQSWLDPFVIITALPAALAGIVWFLFLTGTTLSVPALTGAIMCMGVGTANSILVISFARERLAAHGDPFQAAIESGFARFRPVIMTALAMIIGMSPMALGLGEGGEQNAPLGRAVIGGLVFATIATLMFVPIVFSFVHGRPRARPAAEPRTEEVHA
jgi:multidrug efflux pump subunit AcrB